METNVQNVYEEKIVKLKNLPKIITIFFNVPSLIVELKANT